MAGRPQIFSEEEALGKATQLFWSKGYEATSTDDLLAAMSIGKSSFYNTFKGKRELFEKVIENFVNQSVAGLLKDTEAGTDPVQAIKNFFRKLANSPQNMHQKGCFMGNIVVELSNIDKPLESMAIKRLKKMEQLFQDLIIKAQQSGLLKSNEDPVVIARYLVTMWNGLNITRRMYPDPERLLPLVEMQLSVLK
ncbi:MULTISPECIES: TetR/AcrR family transcriptional regulator [Niastella]|uniref:TetR/AcrR family transcriptional regulator n=1 Tax=Niastella soli TaxID=2821487 RepID=A0ABS3YRH5_9BACT|nr:TetR/AcrR family transcriptional regulator [Niastella soli]MBO9200497.1 TetR/AcrR family transcriptional regulator [Niastella soli]